MNTENSKTNESNKFISYFTDKLNLKKANENIALVNLSIYYTCKNINLRLQQIFHQYIFRSIKLEIVLYLRLKQDVNQNYCQEKQ